MSCFSDPLLAVVSRSIQRTPGNAPVVKACWSIARLSITVYKYPAMPNLPTGIGLYEGIKQAQPKAQKNQFGHFYMEGTLCPNKARQ